MTLIEISEREVLAKAKAWRREVTLGRLSVAEADLVNAVNLLEERERVAGQTGFSVADAAPICLVPNCSHTDCAVALFERGAPGLPDSGASSRDENEATASAPIGGDDADVALDSAAMSPRGDKGQLINVSELDAPEFFREGPVEYPGKPRGLANRTDSPVIDGVPPRPGAEPITRPPRKLSRREREIERRRASDPLGRDRDDIDYSSDELPSVR